jgi:hypothetical protein
MDAALPERISRRMVAESLGRPYPVTLPMVAFLCLIPGYLWIATRVRDGITHAPELALNRAIPLQPAWSLVYGSLYLFLIVLPLLVVREEAHLRRTVWACLAVWLTAYLCFLLYPTAAPRPAAVPGDGFAAWGLRTLYDADPP